MSNNIEKVIKKSQDFETTLADVRKKSEKRAWLVAGVSTTLSCILIGGLIYILPLKEKEPYLVMADAYTGRTTVSKLSGSWNEHTITHSEAINKSNISHFMIARESYDNQLIYLRDWATVYSMSIPAVSNAYKALMNHDNPQSPFHLYGTTKSMRIHILSIVLNSSTKEGSETGATVRFQRFILDKASGSQIYVDNKIATLAYTYNNNLQMDEKYRIENPLGFQVTSYRVDNDTSTPPPSTVVNTLSQTDFNQPLQSDASSTASTEAPASLSNTQ